MRADYDRHMDALATRIATAVSGEENGDVAVACASIIGFTLKDMEPEQRITTLMRLIAFIADISELRMEQVMVPERLQ